MTAIWQLVGLVYLFTLYPIVATIGFIGGLVFMVVDVLSKLILGDPLSDGFIREWGMRLFMWPIDQLKWIITGDESFPFFP